MALRLIATALALVIATVLLLSAAGIYALMSFTVSQRGRRSGFASPLAPVRDGCWQAFSRAQEVSSVLAWCLGSRRRWAAIC